MAILDPPFSILDLANARALPLSLFEQPARGVSSTLSGWSGWPKPAEKIEVLPKQKICISCRNC
jgi:ABC-type uncharacterized transport system ATPase subunit